MKRVLLGFGCETLRQMIKVTVSQVTGAKVKVFTPHGPKECDLIDAANKKAWDLAVVNAKTSVDKVRSHGDEAIEEGVIETVGQLVEAFNRPVIVLLDSPPPRTFRARLREAGAAAVLRAPPTPAKFKASIARCLAFGSHAWDTRMRKYGRVLEKWLSRGEMNDTRLLKARAMALHGMRAMLRSVDTSLHPEPEDSGLSTLPERQFALESMFGQFTERLTSMAARGCKPAGTLIWENATALTNAIQALAVSRPEVLRPAAKRSLFCPAFRVKVKRYDDNFEEIAKNVELSKHCFLNTNPSALYKLSGVGSLLVARRLEATAKLRDLMKQKEIVWRKRKAACDREERLCRKHPYETVKFPAILGMPGKTLRRRRIPILSRVTLKEFLLGLGFEEEDLFLRTLPDYDRTSATIWWERVMKPYLELPETLDSIRGTEFYRTLSKTAKTPKDSDVIARLKDYCKRQVTSFAPPPHDNKPA